MALNKASGKEIFGWAMFDFANSSFTTVIVTVIFSAYFVSHIVGDKILGVKYWGWGLIISNIIVIFSGPIIGAVADFSGSKKKFLFLTSLLCIISTALLFFAGEGDLIYSLIIFIVANSAFAAGENFCASFLPEIAHPDEMGRVSGYGWAFGYIGGLLSLMLCLSIFHIWGTGETQIRSAFLVTALFFLLSALPTFLLLKERSIKRSLQEGKGYFSTGLGRIKESFCDVQDFGELIKFLLVFLVYSCGIYTVIAFSSIYVENVLHFNKTESLVFFIVIQISSSLGAFIFGFIEDWIGTKKTISISLIIWLVVIVGAYLTSSKQIFWIIGNLAGLAIGSSQSSSRAMVALFTPQSKSAEFFGLWGMSSRLAAIAGIFSFSAITTLSGSMKNALLATAIFFLAGLFGLLFIDEKKGAMSACGYTDKIKISD